jgi:ribosomal protein L21E
LGTLTSLSDTSLTVHTDSRDLTCTRNAASPRLGDYHVGDKVKIGCTNGFLTAIAKADSPPAVTTYSTGTLSALSTTSITVHNDERDLTCTLIDGSPKLADYHVGDRVKIYCSNGALVGIASVDTYTGGLGKISALSTSSLTVHTDGGDLTCTVGDASPKLGDYRVGDYVKVYCKNGALYSIAGVETTVTMITMGTLSALSPTSLTVLSDGGEKTCARKADSPSLDGYQVGNHVKATCVNGTLTAIVHL